MPRCLAIMSAQRLLFIIAACDILLHDIIDCISVADIIIIPGCMLLIAPQRLLLAIAVRDIFLHDIIVFMSPVLGIVVTGAGAMLLGAIEPCSICASAGAPPATASRNEAHRIVTWVIINLLEAVGMVPSLSPSLETPGRTERSVDILTLRYA